ncbi:hypothetical protein LUZ60_014036 [Juncus effusus]|nr:hypothetical protein LUZ60_014036 [Juncus effusus]
MDLVGKPVRKKFPKFGVFKGVIDSYDSESGYYKVVYEDGDCEDVDSEEVKSMLMEPTDDEIPLVPEESQIEIGDSVSNQIEKGSVKKGRKKRRISELGSETPITPTPVRRSARQASNAAKAVTLSLSTPDLNNTETNQRRNLGSPSKSQKRRGRKKISEIVDLGPKFELPPSSKSLDLEGLPVLDFFMVYSALRGFSRQFFLSPFKLETFLSALKCTVANPLIDSVHFSLLHALKKHLEVLSEQGSQSAAHCIRNLNWDLLDQFTWPVLLSEYLLIHSSEIKPSINLPNLKLLSTEYYTQPAEIKLEILRCLCDDVMEADLIHSEIDLRKSDESSEPTGDFNWPKKRGRKPKHVKEEEELVRALNAGPGPDGEEEDDKNIDELSVPAGDSSRPKKRGRKPKHVKEEEELVQALNAEPGLDGEEEGEDDKNIDECFICTMDGNLLCCDGCPNAFHSRCVGVAKDQLPEGDWYCPECLVNMKDNEKGEITQTPLKDVRGADMLGIDPHGRLYFWTSDYLLVSDSYETADSCNYYNKSDIVSVLKLLNAYHSTYCTIIEEISSRSSVSLESSSLCNGAIQDIEISPKKETYHSDPSENQNGTETVDELNLSTPNPLQIEDANCTNSEEEKSFLTPNWGKNGTLMVCDKISDPTCYINSYSFGRLALSICVEFLRVLAENRQLKKPIEDFSALQLKAIHNIAPTFCWNSYQKFPIEIQKESCGWCVPCRASETGSYNSICVFKAAFNEKQTESLNKARELGFDETSHISSAIHCVLSLEERLRGLLLGPWENPNFSETWRNEASNALDVKSLSKLLLQLETNLRRAALLSDWTRPVDSTAVVGSAVHISIRPANVSTGSVRKRGRPGRKSNNNNNGSGKKTESNVGINWWRGGRLSREVFSWKRLPRALAHKAGRQGGLKRIPTVVYPEGSDIIARRIKCVAWRASLEMSDSVPQLIFQVKELESYIKWADIGSSQPFCPVTKESKRAVKQFKQVIVWRKITEGPITKYLLDFGKIEKKRNIPPIVVKHGTKFEEPNNERVKYWLAENHLPLHLLRHFEEKKFFRQMKKKDGSTPAPTEKSNEEKNEESAPEKEGSTPAPSEKSNKKKKDGSTPVPSEKTKKKKKDGSTPAPSEKPKKKKDGSAPAPSEKSKTKSKKRVNPSEDLGESSVKKQKRVFVFDHLFEKAQKADTEKCGRCDKDVAISEAVTCQSCEGYFHRKHFKLPKDITAILFICIKCSKDQSAKKPQPKKSPKKEKSERKSKPKASKKKKKQNFNLKKKIELELRRSDRILAKKPQPKKKSKKKYKKKPKKSESKKITNIIPKTLDESETELTWPKRKRTFSPHSYWLNGLHWTGKLNDELNIHFIRSKIIFPTENFDESASNSKPVCSLCVKEYNSQSLYISCDKCEEWFHADAYQVKAENTNKLIGFKCHKCLKRDIPICPYSENSQAEQSKDVPQEQNKLSGTSVVSPSSNKEQTGDFMNIDEKPNDWNSDFMYVVPQEDIIEAIFGEEKDENDMDIEPSNGISQMDRNSMEIEPSNGFSQMDLVQEETGEPNKKMNGLCLDESKEELNGEGERNEERESKVDGNGSS